MAKNSDLSRGSWYDSALIDSGGGFACIVGQHQGHVLPWPWRHDPVDAADVRPSST